MRLLKAEIEQYESALRDPSVAESYQLRPDLPFEGWLFFRATLNRPRWLSFLDEGTTESIAAVVAAANSAVLLVRASKRILAFTFGHGYSMLDPQAIEPDFGLLVALNRVDPERLRSIDVSTIEELPVHTRRQTSTGSPLDTFGLDVSRDLMRVVTGEPRDATFARRVTGSDGLEFTAKIAFDELGTKCLTLIEAYTDDAYKERFGWIDHLRPVRDPTLVGQLDGELVSKLGAPKEDQPHIAPPEPIEWREVEGFTYSSEPANSEPHTDLDLDDYLLSIEGDPTVQRLRSDFVNLHRVDAGAAVPRWQVYECLVFQAGYGDDLYVLTGGRWFRIDQDFAQQVRNQVQALPIAELDLPNAQKGEHENEYNIKAAGAGIGILFDRKLARAGPGEQPIEFCDLLTRKRELIHVKKWSRSSTLSHLFAQGTVSAETLVSDPVFRQEVRDLLLAASPDDLELVSEGRPPPQDFTVVYAIVGKTAGSLLPFFSQLALLQAARRLSTIGFRVGVSYIPVVQ